MTDIIAMDASHVSSPGIPEITDSYDNKVLQKAKKKMRDLSASHLGGASSEEESCDYSRTQDISLS